MDSAAALSPEDGKRWSLPLWRALGNLANVAHVMQFYDRRWRPERFVKDTGLALLDGRGEAAALPAEPGEELFLTDILRRDLLLRFSVQEGGSRFLVHDFEIRPSQLEE
jgi:hypothetical protein